MVVDVEPVERVVVEVGGALEVLGAIDRVGAVEEAEAERRVDLMEEGVAQLRVGDRLAVDACPADHDSQLRALRGEGVGAGRCLVGHTGAPGVGPRQGLERLALAMERVAGRVQRRRAALGVAERDREGVDQVLPGGGGAPGVVPAAPDLHVGVDAGEGGATGVDAGGMHVLLHEDLGREVRDLRAHDRNRRAALRLAGRDQQRVRGSRAQRAVAEQATERTE